MDFNTRIFMQIINTKHSYGLVTQLIHWVMAVCIIILSVVGFAMQEVPYGTIEDIAQKTQMYRMHKTIGIFMFFLAVFRVVWAVYTPKPESLVAHKKIHFILSSIVHWILYISILLVPFVGYLSHAFDSSFVPLGGVFDSLSLIYSNQDLSIFFTGLHKLLARVMIFCIVLHVAGALKHAIFVKSKVLHRMIPGMYKHDV